MLSTLISTEVPSEVCIPYWELVPSVRSTLRRASRRRRLGERWRRAVDVIRPDGCLTSSGFKSALEKSGGSEGSEGYPTGVRGFPLTANQEEPHLHVTCVVCEKAILMTFNRNKVVINHFNFFLSHATYKKNIHLKFRKIPMLRPPKTLSIYR